jgi:hypothetical protein
VSITETPDASLSFEEARLRAVMAVRVESGEALSRDMAVAVLAAVDKVNPVAYARPVDDRGLRVHPSAGDAVDTVCWRWGTFVAAKTYLDQADAIRGVNDAMSDLASWVPGYDIRDGEIHRQDDEVDS